MSHYSPPMDDGGGGLGQYLGLLAVIIALVVVALLGLGLALGPNYLSEGQSTSAVVQVEKYNPGDILSAPGLPNIKINPDEHPAKSRSKHTPEEITRTRDCITSKGAEYVFKTRTPNRFILLCREDPSQDKNWLVMIIEKATDVYLEITSYAVDSLKAVTYDEIVKEFLKSDASFWIVDGGPLWPLP